MDYAALKTIHVASVAASYALFVLRGIWMLRDSTMLSARWVGIVPHGVDTVLLASAIMMALALTKTPFPFG